MRIGRQLQLGFLQIVPGGFLGNGLALEEAHEHIETGRTRGKIVIDPTAEAPPPKTKKKKKAKPKKAKAKPKKAKAKKAKAEPPPEEE